MVIINIFYKDNKDSLSLLRLKLLNYLCKKDKNNVRKEEFALSTPEVTIKFIPPKKEQSISRTSYNYEIINFDGVPNEQDVFSVLDMIYNKKEYYVLEKICLRDICLSKERLDSYVHVRNLNDIEVKQLEPCYWCVFNSKLELNKYIEKHINSWIEECNIKLSLLENLKKEYV